MNMRMVGYLRGLSEGMAICSEDKTFEIPHQKDVAYYAQKLAYERHLDVNIALLIAYGHDLGRLKKAVHGSGHAKESAKIVKTLLKESGMNDDAIKVVSNAIRKHSIKSQIGSDYEELIKDADALAHCDEGILGDSVKDLFESARINVIEKGDVSIAIADAQNWINTFNLLSETLSNVWQMDAFENDPNKWVHSTRILIRQLRGLIWLYHKSNGQRSISDYDKALKKAFNHLSNARMIHVMMLSQNEMKGYQSLETMLVDALESVKKAIMMLSFDPKQIEVTSNFEDSYVYWIRKAFNQFIKLMTDLDSDEIKSVHQARLKGKRFKDWFAMSLITSSDSIVDDGLARIHKSFGRLNDLYDMSAFSHSSRYFDKVWLKSEMEKSRDLCLANAFLFKLYNRKSKENATHYPSIIFEERL